MGHIVKRRGEKQEFDAKKIYQTCFRACLNAHLDDKAAEKVCQKVDEGMADWLRGKKEVSSDEIFQRVISLMALENEDAAFMYETHRDIR